VNHISEIAARAAANARELRPELEQLDAQRQAERRAEELARTLRVSEIPAKYAGVTIDKLRISGENRAAIDLARTIVEAGSYRRSCGFFGPAGGGKTSVACAIANGAIKAGKAARYTTPETLFGRYFSASSYGGDEAVGDLLREFSTTPVLILDDFGSEAVSRPKLAFLAELINARWNADAGCLIVTSNSSFDDLHAKYLELAEKAGDRERGTAIMDRVRALTGDWIPIINKKSQRVFDGAV